MVIYAGHDTKSFQNLKKEKMVNSFVEKYVQYF